MFVPVRQQSTSDCVFADFHHKRCLESDTVLVLVLAPFPDLESKNLF